MHMRTKKHVVLLGLMTAISLSSVRRVTAQTFTTLHSFSRTSGSLSSNAEGAHPRAILSSGTTLYGVTFSGGSSGNGVIFTVNVDGTGFRNLHNFSGGNGGANPVGGLALAGDTLYGTTFYGGSFGNGVVFAINTDGTGFTNLYNFTSDDGAGPSAALIVLSNSIYGTAAWGGSANEGTIFRLNIDDSGFSILHTFEGYPDDGARPYAPLLPAGNVLYGTASGGGDSSGTSYGTVFALNTDGTGFTNLYSFTGGSNGSSPGALVFSGGHLYGTAGIGGSFGNGTVFAVNSDGTDFTNIYSFSAASYPTGTNSDGGGPGSLLRWGRTFYGAAGSGGSSANGTVFAVNTDGAGFAMLHDFKPTYGPLYTNSDGAGPGGMIISGGRLYGVTGSGGAFGNGTLFSISFPPRLTIVPDGSGGFFIGVQGQPNFSCQLQRASGVMGPWISSAPQTASDTGLIEFHDLFPPPGRAFYRTVQQ